MFEKASRLKLRFDTPQGLLPTEYLWDLSLQKLNTMAKFLNKELKESEDEDFLEGSSNSEIDLLKLKFEIVVHVLKTKKKEADDIKDLKLKKLQKEKILDLIQKKKDSALENLSEEELNKKLEELGI